MIEHQRVLVDIDCLHDTRWALYKEHFSELDIDPKKYHTRTSDGFFIVKGANKDKWNKVWAERKKGILSKSKATTMFFELAKMLGDKLTTNKLGAPATPPTLTINIYPYVMTDSEKSVYLDIVRSLYAGNVSEIDIIRKSPRRCDQEFLKGSFEMYICYDFFEWNLHNVEKFKELKCPSLTLVIPALYKYEYAKEAKDIIIRDKVNPFREIKDAYAELMSLEILDPTLFSLHPDFFQT